MDSLPNWAPLERARLFDVIWQVSSDRVTSLAVDGASQAVIAGSTSSTNFPPVSATQPVYAGSGDAFAAELAIAEVALLFSTYLGGSGAT